MLTPGQRIHFVGIGGFGLSAIARVLLQQGYRVSGSDRAQNALTEALAREGATIFAGHDAANVSGADAVIVTSAAARDHVEIAAALERGIPVYKRSDVIADIMRGKTAICIAGTHGKTTTTAMVTHILRTCGQDPSFIVGGVLQNSGQNAGVGQGKAFVIEADEYDFMFLGLRPQIAVITSIEYDHPDFFKSEAEMGDAFRRFAALLPADGLLITCADSPLASELAQNLGNAPHQPRITFYGIEHPAAEWRAANLRVENEYSVFDVFRDGQMLGTARLQLPGKHNVLNALAALAVSDSQDIEFQAAANALKTFTGTGRRFELRGEIQAPSGAIAVIDDYAHHPTAIRATLEAARTRYPDRQIWAVWQPHTYSRTQALMDDYAAAFTDADHVLVTDIYAAREAPVPGVNSAAVVAKMPHRDARHTASLDDTAAVLIHDVIAPAVIIIMSAGDAPRIGADFLAKVQEEA
jgi:UDP-N-acetylmuramate--alanine ligase